MNPRVYIMFFMTMVLTGCVETIVMDPGEEDLPVMVNCVLEAGREKQTLYLQYVKGKSRSEYIPVENATVRMETSEGMIREIEFKYVGDSKYEAGPEIQIGQSVTYDLFVEIPGRETITARTTVPANDCPYWDEKYIEDSSDTYIDLFFQRKNIQPSSPVWIFAGKGRHSENEPAQDRYPYLVTDHPYADNFNNTGLLFSDLSIDGGPDPEDTNEYVKYAWLGTMKMRQMMPGLPLHDGFIRIDHLDNKQFHLLAGPLKYEALWHYDFYFVSEEYDKYLRSVYILDKQLDNNYSSVFSIDNIYTNIEGGVGIFGAVFRDSQDAQI